MKRSSKMAWLGVVLVSLLILFYFRGKTPSQRNIGLVSQGDILQRVTFAGMVNPNRRTVVSAPYNGYIRKVYVQMGQKVQAGDPIVTIAQSLQEKAHELFPLRAPFPGTVVQILRSEGEYVEQQAGQSDSAIVRIDDISQMFVEAAAPEMDIEKLKLGQEATIRAPALNDRIYSGVISDISLAAREKKEWDKVRVEFPISVLIHKADLSLKSGMSVIVDIVVSKTLKVLTLRHEFIEKTEDGFFVTTEDGARKRIEVGTQNEDVFEIRKGLVEGEKIRQIDFLEST